MYFRLFPIRLMSIYFILLVSVTKFGGMLGLISKYGGYDSKTKTNLLNTAARTDNALPIYTD